MSLVITSGFLHSVLLAGPRDRGRPMVDFTVCDFLLELPRSNSQPILFANTSDCETFKIRPRSIGEPMFGRSIKYLPDRQALDRASMKIRLRVGDNAEQYRLRQIILITEFKRALAHNPNLFENKFEESARTQPGQLTTVAGTEELEPPYAIERDAFPMPIPRRYGGGTGGSAGDDGCNFGDPSCPGCGTLLAGPTTGTSTCGDACIDCGPREP